MKRFAIWNMLKTLPQTNMNVVMTEDGRIIEVQGTAEGEPFTHEVTHLVGAGPRNRIHCSDAEGGAGK
ncbi:hypothetical protein ECZU43_54880 [Escherichia coli]|nr:hypothetical protein ECZU43_54880 [Escherichia coli]